MITKAKVALQLKIKHSSATASSSTVFVSYSQNIIKLIALLLFHFKNLQFEEPVEQFN